jgi:ubiquinol-cytochrome c reductase cytochrome c subunit
MPRTYPLTGRRRRADVAPGSARRRVAVLAVLAAALAPGPLPAAARPGSLPAAAPSTGPSTPSTGPSTPAAAPSTAPSAAAPGADGGRGRQLYEQSCASCHGVRGQGSQRGPALVGVGPADVDFQVGTGRMPLVWAAPQPMHRDPVFTAEETRDLVAYVAGFGTGGPAIPLVRPGSLTTGRDIYQANCAACHSAGGTGAALTNGRVAPPLSRATPLQVAEAVRVGPGLMPAFPPQVLTDQQVDAVASYVQQLRGTRLDRGGGSLGRYGPATEGLVAWGAGLLVLVLLIRWLGSRAGR